MKVFRRATVTLVLLLLASVLFSQGKPATIKWFAFQPENVDAYNALLAEYQKVAPNVKVDLEAMQGDYNTQLKIKINAGQAPDIFGSDISDVKVYKEYQADLTDQPFVKNFLPSLLPLVSLNGRVVAIPAQLYLWTPIYDKKAFADAGITELPKTLSQLEATFKKLQAKGITPVSGGFKEWWVLRHVFNSFMSAETNDPKKLAADLISGTTRFEDHPGMMKYFDLIDLLVKYGAPRPLEVDFNLEMAALASHKVAMITGQGNWAEDGLRKMDPSIQIGIMPQPVGEDPSKAKYVTGPGLAWFVNKDSKNLNEVMAFINFWYNSDYSSTYFYGNHFFSPLKTGKPPELMMASPDFLANLNKGNVYPPAPQMYFSQAFNQRFAEIMQDYIAKTKTRQQAVVEIDKAVVQLGSPG